MIEAQPEYPPLLTMIDAAVRELPLWGGGPVDVSGELVAAYEERGVDALAWYCSPELYPASKAGIWIREQGVHLAAQGLTGSAEPTRDQLAAVFLVILAHELFHAIVDRTLTDFGLWLSIRSGRRERIYAAYANKDTPPGAGEPLEEALANAFALRHAAGSRLAPKVAAIRQWMSRQPTGYRDYGRYDGDAAFDSGLRLLGGRGAGAVARSPSARMTGPQPLERALKAQARALLPFEIPTYLIADLVEPVDASLPPADAPVGTGNALDGRTRTLLVGLRDGPNMSLTEDGRASLRELERRAREASNRLRPHLDRSGRARRVEELGRQLQAWPTGPALPRSAESPARMVAALEAAIAALNKQADYASGDLAWGNWRPLEVRSWDKAPYDRLIRDIEEIAQTANELSTAARAAGTYAIRLW